MRRIVITGAGVVTPVGTGIQCFWEGLKAGKSGIRKIQNFDASAYASQIAGEIADYDAAAYINPKELRRLDPYSRYGMGAAKMAIQDSGLDMNKEDPTRVGVIMGSGVGGMQTFQTQHSILLEKGPGRCSPFMIPEMISNICGGLVAIEHGMQGPNYAVVSACASGAHSMGVAMRLLRSGDVDVMVSGGAEASVCEMGVAGFTAMKALSRRNDAPEKASRPFDANRDGFVIADGAGVVVLEELEHARKRGAQIYCELAGFGDTCDAFHMTAPADDGAGAARAMQHAMKDGGVNAEDVGYINAHGTSTNLNDKIETKAIKMAMGEGRARSVMVSSTKSMTGHMLGAAGSVEAIVCAMVLRHGVVPPTTNYETPDPECDLDYVPNTAREVSVNVCLTNSLGFGGHNACLLLKKA